jgi:hypothetical protein
VLLALVGVTAPAHAEVLVVENAEQAEWIVNMIKASQGQYLKASRAMEPCYQGQHDACVIEMRAAIPELPSAVTVVAGVTRYFNPIRNNAFSYERAFSLLFLNALVQGHTAATCQEYNVEAERPLRNGATRTLAEHLKNAETEIGERRQLPEYQMLQRVKAVLSPCVARS